MDMSMCQGVGMFVVVAVEVVDMLRLWYGAGGGGCIEVALRLWWLRLKLTK